jgi:hypothetical protein
MSQRMNSGKEGNSKKRDEQKEEDMGEADSLGKHCLAAGVSAMKYMTPEKKEEKEEPGQEAEDKEVGEEERRRRRRRRRKGNIEAANEGWEGKPNNIGGGWSQDSLGRILREKEKKQNKEMKENHKKN